MDNSRYVPLPDGPAAYKLIDTESGATYIGSTSNLRKRIAHHRYRINRGNHPNIDFRRQVRNWDNMAVEYIPCQTPESARKVEDSLLEFHYGDEGVVNVAASDRQHTEGIGYFNSNGHFDRMIRSVTEDSLLRRAAKLRGLTRDAAWRERMSISAKLRGNNFSEEGISKGRAIRSQPVIVDGVTYASSRAAGRAYGVCEHTAKKRANSDKFTNWSFGPKEI